MCPATGACPGAVSTPASRPPGGGRAPGGGLEDSQGGRLGPRATCPSPAPVVVHDVGGTTADARWVAFDELGGYPLSSSWRALTELTGLAGPAADDDTDTGSAG